ncbi:TIMELESS-interacting protein [Bombyx mori]|uniref:TIMELESS-interacting protein n=1 Tax=Bombyx mori TaxID=7091 RepID=A0A8R2DQP4_BOMMO|nr:TIMELESS-interacting protein [Bombyx mori]
MSLLEDVFLQDEANEARELERVIDGDEFDDDQRASSPDSDDNSAKGDEAEEDTRRVDPQAKTKRVVRNPRFILNPARLTGPRGIQVIPEHFKDFKFRGKGHEKEDLDLILKKLEHWAYRLYPKFEFEDCLKKIESLGKKRPVMVHLCKIRTDQITSEETVVQRDSSEDEAPPQEEDEFDKLLQEQIALARSTPAPESVKKVRDKPMNISQILPKATSSPSINEEQRERMLRNRQLAEERRLAKLKQNVNVEQKRINNDNLETNKQIDDINKVNNEEQTLQNGETRYSDGIEHNGAVDNSLHINKSLIENQTVNNDNHNLKEALNITKVLELQTKNSSQEKPMEIHNTEKDTTETIENIELCVPNDLIEANINQRTEKVTTSINDNTQIDEINNMDEVDKENNLDILVDDLRNNETNVSKIIDHSKETEVIDPLFINDYAMEINFSDEDF